jgi:protein-L-isoaspartate(D-aspartate) O-methyltransferase
MLNVGGRLFAVIGEMPVMRATLTQRDSEDQFKHEAIFETCLPALINAPQATKFEF